MNEATRDSGFINPGQLLPRLADVAQATGNSEALAIIEQYGMTDGAHHKQWVLDQVLRALLGPALYARWVADYNAATAGEGDPWDPGIAP